VFRSRRRAAALAVLTASLNPLVGFAAEPVPVGPSDASSSASSSESSTAAGLTIDQLEALALQHNPTLEQARAETWKTHGRYVQAGLYPNPEIGYVASEVGNDGYGGQQGTYIQQEFVFGGKLGLSQNVASAEREAADHALLLQELRVRNNVRLEYYSILVANRNLDLAKQLYSVAGNAAKLAKIRSEQGEASKLDELQARGEQQRAAVAVAQAGNAVDGAWRRLQAVIASPLLTQQPLAGNIEEHQLPEVTFDELLARMQSTSPQIRLAEARINRAQAAVERAEVEPIPNLTIQNTIQYDASTKFTVVGIQATLPVPVFDRNQGNITEAENEWIRASREVDRLRLGQQRALATRWQQFANARIQVEQYRSEVLPTVSETLKLTRAAYEAGEADYLRLLTAQRSYTETYRDYVAALGAAWQEAVQLNGLLLTDGLAAAESVTD
jgi:cobalt-zinc-cadmium efflux system outer membrane protein